MKSIRKIFVLLLMSGFLQACASGPPAESVDQFPVDLTPFLLPEEVPIDTPFLPQREEIRIFESEELTHWKADGLTLLGNGTPLPFRTESVGSRLVFDEGFEADNVDIITVELQCDGGNWVDLRWKREGGPPLGHGIRRRLGGSAKDVPTYTFMVADNPYWRGKITEIAVHPTDSAASGVLRSVRFLKGETDEDLLAREIVSGKMPMAKLQNKWLSAVSAPRISGREIWMVIPEQGILQVDYGVLPVGWRPGSEPVRFAFQTRSPNGNWHTRFERILDPSRTGEHRWWIHEWVDLRSLSGSKQGLRFIAETDSGDATHAVFANPILSRWPRPASDRRPNFLVVMVDTMRADRIGAYGYPQPTSPWMDRFIRRSVQYSSAWSPSSWTVPSIASLFTGLFPREVVEPNERLSLAGDVTTLAERFRDAGYFTSAITSNPLIVQDQGFARGFSLFRESEQLPEAPEMTDWAVRWLHRYRDQPFLLYVHYMDPHTPYAPPEPYLRYFQGGSTVSDLDPTTRKERQLLREGKIREVYARADSLRARYDGEVRHFDREFGKLIAALRDKKLQERTYVILTSDHGEEFLDHGDLGHGHSLHRELLSVPLALYVPSAVSGIERDSASGFIYEEHVTNLSLYETLLELAELPGSESSRAGVLPLAPGILPTATGTSNAHLEKKNIIVGEVAPHGLSGGPKGTRLSLIHNEQHLLFDVESERMRLFQIDADPAETIPVSSVPMELTEFLEDWRRSISKRADDEWRQPSRQQLRERLEALGYLQ